MITLEERRNFYFQRANGTLVLLVENCTEKEACATMMTFLNERNYKSYYTRIYQTAHGATCYDVGSWSEQFIWAVDEETALK